MKSNPINPANSANLVEVIYFDMDAFANVMVNVHHGIKSSEVSMIESESGMKQTYSLTFNINPNCTMTELASLVEDVEALISPKEYDAEILSSEIYPAQFQVHFSIVKWNITQPKS